MVTSRNFTSLNSFKLFFSYIFLKTSNSTVTQKSNIEYCNEHDSSLIQLESQMKIDFLLENLENNALFKYHENCTRTEICSSWRCCGDLKRMANVIAIGKSASYLLIMYEKMMS